MKVKSYTKEINGRLVTCGGYTRKVKYVIFFRTLGEYERFRLLLEDEESNYEIIDMYQKSYFKFGGTVVHENRYLDRLMVRSETEDRDMLIQILGLRALKKNERKAKGIHNYVTAYKAI